ncbi:hypothetical protein [Nakamurella sp. PAMC28650]|uniref:hypothetical protein n=1 Tax=Nakamurella sp. PAMC28650 TaxID=2762325 RepID=UPI00164ECE12|nr:hypothetical protein [Nakamurella sp. PAMC28650]QNK81577.1 hypothetical protein H7F38_01660 [Nakamurella sp. PAMC28650]
MIPIAFRDFFVAAVGVAGALVGLLFVAVSLAPRRLRNPETAVVAQAQASAALLMFTNTITMGPLALLPDSHVGWPATILATLGLVYGAATMRLAMVNTSATAQLRRIAVGALIICVVEGWGGISALIDRNATTPASLVGASMIASLLFGISRAWELVGLRDVGLFRSLSTLRHPDAASTVGPEISPDDTAGSGL